MTPGHNETAVRLAALAGDAQIALDKVARGEADAVDGWMAYGAALNEGRALFPSDEQFGQWTDALNDKLSFTPNLHERAAAMWAAAHRDQFEEARAAGGARTVRGIHAKWQEIAAERIAEEERQRAAMMRLEAEAHAKAQAEAEEDKRRARSHVLKAEADRRAKEAAKAKADAEKKAAQAEKAADRAEKKGRKATSAPVEEKPSTEAEEPAQEAAADPYGYQKLTEEALLETANGLRAEVDDLRSEVARLKSECAQLKADKEAVLGSKDLGPLVSSLEKQLGSMKFKRDEAMRSAKSMEYRMNQAIKERDEALRKLGEQVIPLDYA